MLLSSWFTLALANNRSIQQIDVNNAFLNGILHENVYMTQPHGFESADSTLVCKLHMSIYGLKQALRSWYERLTSTLIGFGLVHNKCDPSLLTLQIVRHCLYVLIYVNGIIFTCSSDLLLQSVVYNLHSAFALKQFGALGYFLGIEVKHLNDGSLLSQSKYIHILLYKAGM